MKAQTNRFGLVSALPSEFLIHFRVGKPTLVPRGSSVFCLPILDCCVRLPSTTHQIDFRADQITAENQGIEVDGFAAWRIADPLKACTVFDFSLPAETIERIGTVLRCVVESAVRHQVAKMPLDDALRKRGSIILALKQETAHVTAEWGLSLDTIEIRTVKVLSQKLFQNLQARFREITRLEAQRVALDTDRAISELQIDDQESVAQRRFAFQQAETTREQELTRFRLAAECVTLGSECAAEEERRKAALLHARREADVAAIADQTERDRIATRNMKDIRLALLDTLPGVSSGLHLGQIEVRPDMVTDLVRGVARMISSQPTKETT